MGATVLGYLETIISILYGAIVGVANNLAAGLNSLVQNLMFTNGDLSIFAGVAFMFMGISLAIALSRFVLTWILSLGRNK